MCNIRYKFIVFLFISFTALPGRAAAQVAAPNPVSPAQNVKAAPRTSNISATFAENMAAATDATFVVTGSQTGKIVGTYLGDGSTTLSFDPTADFRAGEEIQVVLTTGLQNAGQTASLGASYVWRFLASADVAPADFSAVGENFGTGSDDTRSVALGDVNGDGRLDIALGNNGQNVVYLQKTDGAFDTQAQNIRNFGTGSDFTHSVALGDVNGDGRLDIAAGGDGQNVVYLQKTDGAFDTQAQNIRNFGTGSDNTRSVASGDVNGDGRLDIALGNVGQNVVYLQKDDGTFDTQAQNIRNFGTGDFTGSVALGDVNGDGRLDIAVGNSGSSGNQNVVYLQKVDGSFDTQAQNIRNFGTGSDVTVSVALGDVNGDGRLDIAAGNSGLGEQNVVYLQKDDGTFDTQAQNIRNFGTGSDNTWSVGLGDVNGDGRLDIALGNNGGQNVVYLQKDDGAFDTQAQNIRNFGTGSDVTFSVALGDVNGDGRLDIALGNIGQNVVYLNEEAVVPAVPTLVTFGGANQPTFTLTLDWNDVANATSYTLEYADNAGFSNPTTVPNITQSQYAFATGLADGTYHWHVKAVGPGGESAFSTADSFVIIPTFGEWTVILLATAMMAYAVWRHRRREDAAAS